MVEHVNFYENLKEAHIRLRSTMVLYDGDPYFLFAICNHKPDGVFRVYLDPIGAMIGQTYSRPQYDNFHPEAAELGVYLDGWLEANPTVPIIRKMMNSPAFSKFRPFPLGMCNVGNGCVYVERQPTRKTEQGLTNSMLDNTPVTLSSGGLVKGARVDMWTPAFRACIKGEHPSAEECLKNLQSGEFENEAVAFSRHFAFVNGPIGVVFLAYKRDVVGVLPRGDTTSLRLGKGYRHLKEVVSELGLFGSIEI